MGDDGKPGYAVEVIQRIAQAANTISAHAAIGGCETAGVMISFLAAHPDRIEAFFRDGWLEAVGDNDPWATGCLTFHRKLDGRVTTPQDLRISKTVRDLSRQK